ncbi:MAG: PIG-L family deacetylase [Lachnospiraceae bacterium]|nr:PIG-L family deacetylase [Lachnospiraceae bacterium]
MSLTGVIVNKVIKLPKVTDFNSYLFVGPHPDDIEIGAGALISKLIRMGKKVSFIICLDGRFGSVNCPLLTGMELVKTRQKEALQSAEMLGVKDVRFLGFSDGGFYDPKELERTLVKTIGEIGPDIIFGPDPDMRNECHKDHIMVGEVLKRIGYLTSFTNIMDEYGAKATDLKAMGFFMTDKPNSYVKVSKADFEKQVKAVFECHLTQYPKNSELAKNVELYMRVRSFDYGLRKFGTHGECFRILDSMRMHCLPEG